MGSSGISLYKGKRPRSLPWDESYTIETGSHEMTLVWIGNGLVQLAQDWSNDTQLANWVSIGMICYQGIHLRVSSSVISLYKGKQPRSRPWDEVVLYRHSIGSQFALNFHDSQSVFNLQSILHSIAGIGIWLTVNTHSIDKKWHSIDSQFALNWNSTDCLMAFNWQSIGL